MEKIKLYNLKKLYDSKIYRCFTINSVVRRSFSLYNLGCIKQQTRLQHSESTEIEPFSKKWCKEKKIEIYKKGILAVFEDMSKLKKPNYFAKINENYNSEPLTYHSLDKKSGVYMITNKITKKIYIGMSINLKSRFYNYMDKNRLNRDKSIRINRALIKYGFENFSIAILELYNNTNKVKTSFLRKREDFFIKVFKPQYNIKRSLFNRDYEINSSFLVKIKIEIPTKIKNLLDKCLDPKILDYNIIDFRYSKMKYIYYIAASTPQGLVKASSEGWFEGTIQKDTGFETRKIPKLSLQRIVGLTSTINTVALDQFYLKEAKGFASKRLKEKIKALNTIINNKTKL